MMSSLRLAMQILFLKSAFVACKVVKFFDFCTPPMISVGTLFVYFIKACSTWWLVVVLYIGAALQNKEVEPSPFLCFLHSHFFKTPQSSGSLVLSHWFGYCYPCVPIILALATKKIGRSPEYAW